MKLLMDLSCNGGIGKLKGRMEYVICHDDTVDRLLVLAGIEILKKLEQVTILTSDPLKKVISRVEQYQAYSAYCQEPISPTKTNISPRILHSANKNAVLLNYPPLSIHKSAL